MAKKNIGINSDSSVWRVREKLVNEALQSHFQVETIYRSEEIGDTAMARMSSLASPSPALAVVHKPANINITNDLSLSDCIGNSGLFLALDTIRDPGNLGTIIRIADWFGIKAIFAAPDTVDVFNPKVVQATMGAIFRVQFHYVDIPSVCKSTLKKGGNVYGTFLDGNDMYAAKLQVGSEAPAVIVIGNESNGISREVADLVSDRLFIPPYPKDEPGSESLNAAIATAITVAEFRRRI